MSIENNKKYVIKKVNEQLYIIINTKHNKLVSKHVSLSDAEIALEDLCIYATRNQRKVVCQETGEEYSGVEEVAQKYDVSQDLVYRAIREKRVLKKGHSFRFEDTEVFEPTPVRNTNRRVKCVETGVIYKNTATLAEAYGISRKLATTRVSRGNKFKRNKGDRGEHYVFIED